MLLLTVYYVVGVGRYLLDTEHKTIDSITLSSVEFAPDRLSELDGKQIVKTIAKVEIEKLSLVYGPCSERPVRQVVVSILVILFGLYFGLIPTVKFAYDTYTNTGVDVGHPFSKGLLFIVFPVFFIPYGISLFLGVARKRYYLYVKTKAARRKIVFNDVMSPQEVDFFIYTAMEKYGYVVDK